MIRRGRGRLPRWLRVSLRGEGCGRPLARREASLQSWGGALGCGESRGDESLPAVVDGERAIQVRVDIDTEASIAAAGRTGVELQDPPVELESVVVLDGALVLEAADAVKVGRG